MAINNVQIPYPDFKLNDVIDPEEFDLNNARMVDKINEVVGVLNQITDSVETGGSGADVISLTPIEGFVSEKLQAFLEEVITKLRSTTDGDSGADFIASTAIDGVNGSNVQEQLESLKSLLDALSKRLTDDYYSKSDLDAGQLDNRYFTKAEVTQKLATKTNVTGDHKGTWHGLTPGQASERINGARLDVVEAKLSETDHEAHVLDAGVHLVTSDRDTLLSDFSLEGDEIVNHAPLFDSGAWSLSDEAVVNSPTKITLTATMNNRHTWLNHIYSINKNTTYTLSLKHNGKVTVRTYNLYGEGGTIVPYTTDEVITFTTLSSTERIAIILSNEELGAGTYTFEEVTLVEGSAPKPFVANAQPIRKPYVKSVGKNFIPPFYKWDNVYRPAMTTIQDYYVVFNTPEQGGDNRTLTTKIQVLPNQTYTVSANFKGRLLVRILDKDGNILGTKLNYTAESNDTPERTVQDTFTTEPNAKYLSIAFHNQMMRNTDAWLKDLQLELGSTATPFEPYEESVQVLDTNLYAGEKVEWRDGKAIKTKKKEEVILDGNLEWLITGGVGAGYTNGYKRFSTLVPNSIPFSLNDKLVKYDGSLLKQVVTVNNTSGADVFGFGNDQHIYINIANEDSGWGDNYTPTLDEVKAFFLGWKMYNRSSGINAYETTYDGTGTKGWCRKGETTGQYASGTDVLPTEMVVISSYWQPYRLIYELAEPQQEEINVLGEVKLSEGANHIEVGQGLVKNEIVNRFAYHQSSGEYRLNVIDKSSSPTDGISPVKYSRQVKSFANLYKNGLITEFDIADGSVGYWGSGKGLIVREENFDPNATYTVDYLMMDYLSVPANNVTIEYPKNIGTTVNELVKKTVEQQEDIDGLKVRKANKKQENWIEPTLLNGWKNMYSSASTFRFFKDEFGIVHVEGFITGGVISSGVAIMVFPKGYRPKFSIRRQVGGTNTTGTAVIRESGILELTGSLSETMIISFSFLAEN